MVAVEAGRLAERAASGDEQGVCRTGACLQPDALRSGASDSPE